jgi:hypothetical protein
MTPREIATPILFTPIVRRKFDAAGVLRTRTANIRQSCAR